MGQRIANLSNNPILPASADLIPVYTSMKYVQAAVIVAHSVDLELGPFNTLLERAGVPSEVFITMDEDVAKLSSAVSSRSTCLNFTVSVHG